MFYPPVPRRSYRSRLHYRYTQLKSIVRRDDPEPRYPFTIFRTRRRRILQPIYFARKVFSLVVPGYQEWPTTKQVRLLHRSSVKFHNLTRHFFSFTTSPMRTGWRIFRKRRRLTVVLEF